jgi:M3 family oligoendopeptidase
MTQPSFEQITSPTPDADAIQARYAEFTRDYQAANDEAGRLEVLGRWQDLRRELGTWGSHVSLRFQQDTRDADRKAALEACHELSPKLNEWQLDFMRLVSQGEHGAEIAARYGQHMLDLWDCEMASYEPAVEEQVIAEAKTSQAYTELLSSASFEFQGETLNLSQLGKYTQDQDRDVRHAAARTRWDWFEENAAELDRLYDELVKLRAKQAEILGFPSYIELGYKKMGRTDYNRDDVERYRKAVLEHVVPLCARIRKEQAAVLGVDPLMAWDESVPDNLGNPKPTGTYPEKMQQARAMFDEMGSGLGSFFRMMDDGDFLDLEAREGKAGGGFCTSFPTIGVPFIFANFNGTKGDVEVFTHEVGHAFQNYSSRDKETVDYLWPTYEAAEVHSMSLEYLTWPHMEKFFGKDAERFRRLHLTESLLFLPYGVAVDHFQHLVYDKPDATPAERLGMWRELEALYLPWRNWGDLARPAAGGMWQGQTHIYKVPFYYIDYTLAGVCAMQFWGKAEKDRTQAMKDYVALCQRGGEAPFQDLVRSAGLISPLDEGCLEGVVAMASDYLGLSPASA